MYFPRTAEYALRAVAHLARLPEGQGVRAQELAAAADIPPPYLSKILRKLVLAGLLKSKKGHGGGFMLARPAKVIRFLDVIEAADYETSPAECAFGWGQCDPHHPCPLHPAWAQLRETFIDWAARSTLSDVQAAPFLSREVRLSGHALSGAAPPAEPPKASRRKAREPVREPAAKRGRTSDKAKARR